MSGQPDPGWLLTATELLAHAQQRLDELPACEQADADQGAEELRALFALRELPVTEPVLLGWAVGVAEHARLLSELGTHTDRSTWELRDDLLLLVARLAQTSVEPTTLHALINDQPPAVGGCQ